MRLTLNSLLPFIFSIAVSSLNCCALSTSAAPRAQDLDDVSINGSVLDENGATVPGARVTATLTATKTERAVATGSDGRYRIVELEAGTYVVRVSAAGFAVEERANLSTVAGQNVRLDFTLRPAGVSAEQIVVGEQDAPLLDTTRTVTGGTVTREEIERLPVNTRSPFDLIFTLPGVT
ncbi:MAG: carboxypeptidase-like regulatory domain-containing protein, partial [Pyrinomonadaceae bacterium]